MNLFDGINTELARARQLLEVYKSIPTGLFGAAVIKYTIEQAESSMKNLDIKEMITAYNNLKNLK